MAITVGVAVGEAVGAAVGVAVGVTVGADVGVAVGVAVGVDVGVAVGVAVGAAVGEAVGVAVGAGVGADVQVLAGTMFKQVCFSEAPPVNGSVPYGILVGKSVHVVGKLALSWPPVPEHFAVQHCVSVYATVSVMVTEVKSLHPWNAYSSMNNTDERSIVFSALQSQKAHDPMD